MICYGEGGSAPALKSSQAAAGMATDTAQGKLQKHRQHDPLKHEILPVFRRALCQRFLRCAKPTKLKVKQRTFKQAIKKEMEASTTG